MRESLVIALLLLVGCGRPEKGSMTIHALAPTGDTYYRPPQPIWRFAITNTGSCDVVWESWVEHKGGVDQDYSHAGGHIDWPEGILAPGQSVFTNMIVPARAGSEWRACITFWPVSPEDVKRSQGEAERFDSPASDFCPHPEGQKRVYNDEWHH